jgi:hypothetical protein
MKLLIRGDSSPGSREAEGEGDEDFYIAGSGKRANLLVSMGGLGLGWLDKSGTRSSMS